MEQKPSIQKVFQLIPVGFGAPYKILKVYQSRTLGKLMAAETY